MESIEKDLSYEVLGAAIEVHYTLGGPGLLESVYESCLVHELKLRGLRVERQVQLPVKYKGLVVKDPLFLDILVEKQLVIEVKAIEKELNVHRSQLLTYLRLSGLKLGLLVNFGRVRMKDGISRVVNGM